MTQYHFKTCRECGGRKPLADFYQHAAMADGYLNKCKACVRARVKRHRDANVERVREYDRARGSRMTAEDTRRWREANPAAYKAHCAVNNAVRDGRLVKEPCEVCGSEDVHGHHDDYSRPLDVRWLCAAHHSQEHHA